MSMFAVGAKERQCPTISGMDSDSVNVIFWRRPPQYHIHDALFDFFALSGSQSLPLLWSCSWTKHYGIRKAA